MSVALIVGATGAVGSELVKILGDSQHFQKIVILARRNVEAAKGEKFQRFTEVLRMESYLSNQLVEVNQKNFAHFRETLDAFIKMDKLEIFLFLDVETFDKISKMLRPVVCSKFDNDLRLAVILIFLTKGVSQNAIALWSGISQPSISRILRQGFDDICEKFGETIKWPTAEQIAYQQDLTKNKIPSFGQIDGKLWYVNRPPGTGTLNMSYKSRFAFNSLFVVDNEARIIYIQLSKNGCHSDGQMFNAGPISKLLEKNKIFHHQLNTTNILYVIHFFWEMVDLR
ncbi:unnamed protein product [Caenorhabditis angaria]|uniref:Semialdehyde dehydrogenase NAD-binding domain-containing protein n=1 Tax=Caenorhabditis angaria TaxID=860376 RepID=A0A9P1IDE5_9PELO|nr:unnamed protein product [Caenorhabditis angaria]